ncbi:MAG: T9SS type A sorting domain-containing protein [Bacteroidota bacterium]|nr:T9SS type A sorting domain-containing protein [Candidatus Kapabacteria bacterium]MDW8219147.1 T9SS type A sorting domain-containing protein [Bacteroidota bacterium]
MVSSLVCCIPLNAQDTHLSPLILVATSGTVGYPTDLILLARRTSLYGLFNLSARDIRIEGQLFLRNPTVFYPKEWLAAPNTTLYERILIRQNDSTYTVILRLRCTVASVGCDTLARLRGDILAASDSVSEIRLTNLLLSDNHGQRVIPSTSVVLTIRSIGAPLPIIRIAQLHYNAPNPFSRMEGTSWTYTIDEPSDIEFSIFNAFGQEIERIERKNQPRGTHVEIWKPKGWIASGVYYIRFSSSTGAHWRRCIVE